MASGRVVPARRVHRHQPAALCRGRRRLLQPARHLRAVHQGRQERDQVDAAVMPHLRRQRGSPSTPCPRVQPRQLSAQACNAQDGAAVVADQPAREAGQDRREGGEPWALRDLPDGRGCGVSSDVPGNPIADRAAAGTARAGMTRRSEQMRRTTRAEVRPDEGRATRLSASARSTGDFDHLPCTPHTICRCSRRPKGRAWPHNDPESGECRLNAYLYGRDTFYWDQHAYQTAAGNYTMARNRHWTHLASNINLASEPVESIKYPLEHRIWFNYPGQ